MVSVSRRARGALNGPTGGLLEGQRSSDSIYTGGLNHEEVRMEPMSAPGWRAEGPGHQ